MPLKLTKKVDKTRILIIVELAVRTNLAYEVRMLFSHTLAFGWYFNCLMRCLLIFRSY